MKTQKIKTKKQKQIKQVEDFVKLVNEKYRSMMKKLAYE